MRNLADKMMKPIKVTENRAVDWLSPTDEQKVTTGDFSQMVHNAEREKGMSLSQYKEKMNVWWQNHL